jgi:hypothetical protein
MGFNQNTIRCKTITAVYGRLSRQDGWIVGYPRKLQMAVSEQEALKRPIVLLSVSEFVSIE